MLYQIRKGGGTQNINYSKKGTVFEKCWSGVTVMMEAKILSLTSTSCILPLICPEEKRSIGVKFGLSGSEEVGLALPILPMRNRACSALCKTAEL